jgi:predicted dehydrogenase
MFNRRTFIASAGGATLFHSAPAILRGQNLNSKLQIVGVGCEGKGWSDISTIAKHAQAQYVGFCDIDLSRTQNVRQLNPDAPIVQNYRELFDLLGDKFDAATVSTPDHMHAYIALDAMRRGKHVYCQKPLTHNVWEARQMTRQAKKSGVITRMGNQIHSHGFYRSAVQAVHSGAIGKVQLVHSWCSTTGHGKSFHISRPISDVSVPKSVDWNLWIGVAPMRPFGGDRVYHPWGWRDWQDFGNGALGDFGCHILDPVFSALKIQHTPTELVADHTGMNQEVWPAQTTVEYLFKGTEMTANSTISITWNDGGRLPSTKGANLPENYGLPPSGSLLIGDKGSLVIPHVGKMSLFPKVDAEDLEDLSHYHGWVDGCISGKQPSDGFDYAGPLTESVLLGNIAVRYRGTKLIWDSSAMKFTNHAEANRWLKRDYREGWGIDEVADA